ALTVDNFCDGGATRCPMGAMFCDDFETSSGSNFPRWSSVRRANYQGGAIDPLTDMTTSSTACRGTVAAHARGVGGAQVAALRLDVSAHPNPMYVRAWFRIASSSPVTDYELVGIQNAASDFILIDHDRSSQMVSAQVQGIPTLTNNHAPAIIAPDRWTCIQLKIAFDATPAGQAAIALYER